MKKIRYDSLFLLLTSLLLLVVTAVLGAMLLQSFREYQAWRERETDLRSEVAVARSTFERQEAYLNRLLHDEVFFERVVRDRLGYSREDELIFRFDEGQKK